MDGQTSKSSNKMLYIIVALLVVVIAVLVFLLVNQKDSKESSNTNTSTNTNTNTSSNTGGNTNSNNPGFEEKQYVKDADYVMDYQNQHTSDAIIQKGEKIKVPTINFDTEDAKKVNAEIKSLYTSYETRIKETKECIANKENQNRPCGNHSIGYKVYVSDNHFSVVVLMQSSGASYPVPEYLVYNFDKKGKLLTIDELMSSKGFTKDKLIEKAKQDILTLANSSSYQDSGMKEQISKTESFLKTNTGLNQTKVTVNSGVAYFLDETGNFQVITTVYVNPNSENSQMVLVIPHSAA